jgi:gamma-glutamyl phosphate reductase
MNSPQISSAISQQLQKAREAYLLLANLDNSVKNKILNDLAKSLRENSEEILAENARDMAEAEKMLENGELSESSCKRVLLNEDKIVKVLPLCLILLEKYSRLPVLMKGLSFSVFHVRLVLYW